MRSKVVRSILGVALLCATAAHAQTVDEIVAKNLEAKGGAEKWSSVKAVKMTGKITMQGMDLPMTVYAKRPNSNRQEMVVKGQTIVQAFDGTTAWSLNPMMSEMPQEAPAPVADMVRARADFDGALINYKEKGTTIELVGKETLDGRDVYHLKVTAKGNHVQQYYLDAETGLETKTAAEVDPMGMGQKQTLEIMMADYRTVDGITLPHSVTQNLNGKPIVKMTVDKVELNPTLDETMFRMPKK